MASLQFKAAKARARALRAEFAARGEFTQQAFQNALAAKLAEFRGDAFEGFVAKAADEVDAESTRDRDDDQPRLPVVEWDLDGEYKLDDGRRIAKRLAQLVHADQVMANDDRNMAAVMTANVRKREELSKLRPYWRQDMTKEQAVVAFAAAQESAA